MVRDRPAWRGGSVMRRERGPRRRRGPLRSRAFPHSRRVRPPASACRRAQCEVRSRACATPRRRQSRRTYQLPPESVRTWPARLELCRIPESASDSRAVLAPVPSFPRVETMEQEQELHGNQMLIRVFGTILGVLAMCALILAAIGTFGVIAYGVALRTREIGLRIALGGTHSQVVGLFVSEGMRAIGAGLAGGVVLALAASQILRAMLVGLSPFDPITYAMTLAFFGTVALLACWLPARRAARIEPMVALRGE